MSSSGSSGGGSSPLNDADSDANGNFGFGNVVNVISPCSHGSSPAASKAAASSAATPGTSSEASPAKAPGSSSATISPEKKHWVEIVMVDQENMPLAGQAYEITVPDGTVVQGSTDAKGRGRVDGIDAGNCKITFPLLDKDAWKKK